LYACKLFIFCAAFIRQITAS